MVWVTTASLNTCCPSPWALCGPHGAALSLSGSPSSSLITSLWRGSCFHTRLVPLPLDSSLHHHHLPFPPTFHCSSPRPSASLSLSLSTQLTYVLSKKQSGRSTARSRLDEIDAAGSIDRPESEMMMDSAAEHQHHKVNSLVLINSSSYPLLYILCFLYYIRMRRRRGKHLSFFGIFAWWSSPWLAAWSLARSFRWSGSRRWRRRGGRAASSAAPPRLPCGAAARRDPG
jgi:hypothetical protein